MRTAQSKGLLNHVNICLRLHGPVVYLSHEGPILGALGALQNKLVERKSDRGMVPVHVCFILVVLGLGL